MEDKHEMNSAVLYNTRSITRKSFVLEGLATMSSKYFGKMDLNRLLELLNTTNDINMQIRVFSALSAHLMFNKDADISVLLKSNAVYDKIHNVLSQGLPRSSSDALNFLSTLLYDDSLEECARKRLAAYARNMARLSGCLSVMCEMFTNCMMFHDTWKALCQCLALACSGCQTNQSYCSHLIPVCIQKCCQENLDILVVLQSLILNHTQNIELFQECRGVSIFTREILHYDKCLHLLTTYVKCSKTSTSLLQHILPVLQDFIRLYGLNSQLGQKAIIILHHISSITKGKEPIPNTTQIITHANDTEEETTKKVAENNNSVNKNLAKLNDFEETKVLIQNVMKEIYNWKQSELHNKKKCNYKSFIDANKKNSLSTLLKSKQKFYYKTNGNKAGKVTKNINEIKKLMESRKHRTRDSLGTELSLSFIEKKGFKIPGHRNTTTTMNSPTFQNDVENRKYRTHDNLTIATERSVSYLVNNDFKVPVNRTTTRNIFHNDSLMNTTISCKTLSDAMKKENNTLFLRDFKPIFQSTPRHISRNENYTEASISSYTTLKTQPNQNKHENLHKVHIESERDIPKVNRTEATVNSRNSENPINQKKLKIIKMRRQKAKREYQKEKGKRNCSLSARFFGAINDSCTTFVKTVKNIFNKKEISNRSNSTSSDDFTENTIKNDKRSHHTHSFLNYMQKRDAVLNSNWTREKYMEGSRMSTAANSCKTCDDTTLMKTKLTRDDFLKLTVKKLKQGINVYGCNFKKISKTMWPRERYMTPLVLNNLYRKLLEK